jgi:predicted esterase
LFASSFAKLVIHRARYADRSRTRFMYSPATPVSMPEVLMRFALVRLSLAMFAIASQAVAGPFDIANKKPESAFVVASTTTDASALPPAALPPMHLREQSVVASLSADQLRQLGKIGSSKRIPLPADAAEYLTLRVSAGETSRIVRILRTPTGEFLVPLDDAKAKFAQVVIDDALTPLLIDLSAFAGSTTKLADDPKPGEVKRLTADALRASPITLDAGNLKARFTYGGAPLEPTTRKIADEAVFVRLPKKFDPRLAHGLLVYVHPGPTSGIHAEMHAVLDELNMIAVAPDNVPNDRHRVDRMQLTLDAIATACNRYIIDPDRIHVTGVSGGGKIATHTWAAAPDIIDGVIAIVGVGSYENMRRDDGKYWRGDFSKPLGVAMKNLKAGRIAAITGDEDGNQDYIRKALAIMKGDGITTKLDDYPDMAHEMATPERFALALKWVDEPARVRRDAAESKASEELAAVKAAIPGSADAIDIDTLHNLQSRLETVMAAAPFSEPAWQAADAWRKLQPVSLPHSDAAKPK